LGATTDKGVTMVFAETTKKAVRTKARRLTIAAVSVSRSESKFTISFRKSRVDLTLRTTVRHSVLHVTKSTAPIN
jgi:hypothetical protein